MEKNWIYLIIVKWCIYIFLFSGQVVDATSSKPTAGNHPRFNAGDKVQVLMDVETLKVMQEGHGGWNPRMAEVSIVLI